MLRRSTLYTAAAIVIVLAAAEARAAANDKIVITIGAKSVTATGISPGSTAVFFGAAKVPMPGAYMDRPRHWTISVDDSDHDGTVTFSLNEDVPPASLWAVVDLRNAQYAIANGPRMGLRPLILGNPLRKSKGGTVDHFSLNRSYADFLYVKPGLGAFTWTAMDGSTADDDGPNGGIAVALQQGKSLGGDAQKPINITPGGVLIVLDWTTFEIGAVEIDEALLGGAR